MVYQCTQMERLYNSECYEVVYVGYITITSFHHGSSPSTSSYLPSPHLHLTSLDHLMPHHFISYHILYHIISYHIISYHIISYHIISYHIISYRRVYHIVAYLQVGVYHIVAYHDRNSIRKWTSGICRVCKLYRI